MNKKSCWFLILIFCVSVVQAQDQSLDEQEIINIENLYKNSPAPQAPPAAAVTSTEKSELPKASVNEEGSPAKTTNVTNISDLNKLAPFSDVSVIQKKYLSKTGRFQLYGGAGMATNSPWFHNLGLKINLGYNFSENLGIEFTGMFLTNSERDAAKDLRANNSLQPEKFVVTKNNVGIDLAWSPIYGKVTTLTNRIIPFDMYFNFGGGISGTSSQEKNVSTLHIGTGQIFAVSKNTAFRWDYSWNMYQATPEQDISSTTAPSKNTYNDLIFTAGFSFFFPEAVSR